MENCALLRGLATKSGEKFGFTVARFNHSSRDNHNLDILGKTHDLPQQSSMSPKEIGSFWRPCEKDLSYLIVPRKTNQRLCRIISFQDSCFNPHVAS
jgi:hypothetical protein